MHECRNCGSTNTQDLGPVGEIAPFLLKRVLNVEYGIPPSRHPVKQLLRKVTIFRKLFSRIYGVSVLAELQLCRDCTFVQTTVPFPEESIMKLYVDYRSDTYNEERIRYEPEYAAIAEQVGNSEQEIKSRVCGLTTWLDSKLDIGEDFSMLDYGGADGKFLPNLGGAKYVFEVSDISPAQGVVKIEDPKSLGSYSYIQLAHVLEHVPHPLALTMKASSYLKTSGYLYVEVPQEIDSETIARLAAGDRSIDLPIHEHINRYTPSSVTKLVESAGLELIDLRSEIINLGWTKALIIGALAAKR
jgi:hypothetical protein